VGPSVDPKVAVKGRANERVPLAVEGSSARAQATPPVAAPPVPAVPVELPVVVPPVVEPLVPLLVPPLPLEVPVLPLEEVAPALLATPPVLAPAPELPALDAFPVELPAWRPPEVVAPPLEVAPALAHMPATQVQSAGQSSPAPHDLPVGSTKGLVSHAAKKKKAQTATVRFLPMFGLYQSSHAQAGGRRGFRTPDSRRVRAMLYP
jgi:hypothetical protein